MIAKRDGSRTQRAGGSAVGRLARFGAHTAVRPAMVALLVTGALAPVATAQPPAAVFSPTGAEQFYVVPAGVTMVSIDAIGAPGGGGCAGGAGGLGGHVLATFAASP